LAGCGAFGLPGTPVRGLARAPVRRLAGTLVRGLAGAPGWRLAGHGEGLGRRGRLRPLIVRLLGHAVMMHRFAQARLPFAVTSSEARSTGGEASVHGR